MFRRIATVAVASLLAAGGLGTALAENVDPDADGSRYVWAENVGWINAEPSGDGGPGMQVDDFEVRGWMWGENVGWISLSSRNRSNPGVADYGVMHDGAGVLTGRAWGENVGWVTFDPPGAGVVIDPATGEFSGRAWGENVGWISFDSTGSSPFRLKTAWTCDPPPDPPLGSPLLTVTRSADDVVLQWSFPEETTGVDVVAGDLDVLRSTAGDFTAATDTCLEDNQPAGSRTVPGEAIGPDARWYLARGVNCGGAGTYDGHGVGQVGSRDGEIGAALAACP